MTRLDSFCPKFVALQRLMHPPSGRYKPSIIHRVVCPSFFRLIASLSLFLDSQLNRMKSSQLICLTCSTCPAPIEDNIERCDGGRSEWTTVNNVQPQTFTNLCYGVKLISFTVVCITQNKLLSLQFIYFKKSLTQGNKLLFWSLH